MRVTGSSYLLIIITGIYLLMGGVYLLVIPPWETPDEPSHYRYIAYVADTGRLPVPGADTQSARYEISLYEWHHPPLYYLIQAGVVRGLRLLMGEKWGVVPLPSTNPDFSFTSPSRRFLLPAGWWGLHREYQPIIVLRVISLLLSAPSVAITFWIGKEILRSKEMAVLAAAIVGLTPQYLFINATLKNDGLADLWAAIVFALLVYLTSPPLKAKQWHWVVLLSLGISLGLLSKMTSAFLLLVVGVWGIWLLVRKEWKVCHLLALALPVIFLVGGYLIGTSHGRSVINYWLSIQSHKAIFRGNGFEFLRLLSSSLWARFGWMNVEVGVELTSLLTLMIIAGVGLSVVRFFWHSKPQENREAMAFVLLAIGTNLLLVLYIGWMKAQPQGRFVFPVFPLLVIMAERGYSSISHAWGRILSWGMVLSLLVLNVVSILYLMRVYYSVHV